MKLQKNGIDIWFYPLNRWTNPTMLNQVLEWLRSGVAVTIYGQKIYANGRVERLEDWTVRRWRPTTSPKWNLETHHVREAADEGNVVRIEYAFALQDLPHRVPA